MATTVHRKHYIQNVSSRDYAKVISLGYNVLDVGPDASFIKSLPKGTQAMVWVGNTQCSGFDMKWDKFQNFVKANAKNSKIYGYYLSDEPNAPECSWVAHSITVRDSKTHADLVSLNPYPCRMGRACDYGLIDREFKKVIAAGIGKSKIVSTRQAFGEECNPKKAERNWRTPTSSEMKNMLARWEKIFKDNRMTPAMDDTYTWGPSDICPPLSKNSSLQKTLKAYNAKH